MAAIGMGFRTRVLSSLSRRDFLVVCGGTTAGIVAAEIMWPLIAVVNASGDNSDSPTTDVDLSAIDEGQIVTVKWRGKPVFVRRRTQAEIDAARNVQLSELVDPQTDSERVKKPEWLVVVGLCTHLGCVPLGHQGPFGGWFCPCHSSVFDTSGRTREGPAPRNLDVPPYVFLSETKLRIG
jgi:ubiquinol-cytochrome c reductase iron-sulfur subunit